PPPTPQPSSLSLHDALPIWGAGEETVAVRVVGRPEDLVRTDLLGEDLEAALDRFERDPAIAPEDFAGSGFQSGIVEALVVEMSVDRKSTRLNSSHVAISYAV